MVSPFRQSVWKALSPHAEAGRRSGAERPRIVLVHGSVMGGRPTWSGQRALGDEFELEIVERPGFPPNPPVERVDFDEHALLVAERLEGGAHLVGHSYGGVIALLAAAAVPDQRAVADRDRAARDARRPRQPGCRRVRARGRRVVARPAPRTIRRRSCAASSTTSAPTTSRPRRSPEHSSRARGRSSSSAGRGRRRSRSTRSPQASFPTLVVSGGHHAAFDAVCDVLVERLGAERLVLPGYGHTAQRHPEFNAALADFVDRADDAERRQAEACHRAPPLSGASAAPRAPAPRPGGAPAGSRA